MSAKPGDPSGPVVRVRAQPHIGGVTISAGITDPSHSCIDILISTLVTCVWYEEGMARSHPDAPRAPLLRSRARSARRLMRVVLIVVKY